MRRNKAIETQPLDLRARAEAELHKAAQKGRPAHFASEDEYIHELQVHQIELEMQNHELRQSSLLLEIARDRYADLYDFAPVGYLTLDSADSTIIEANLTAAELLGMRRAALIGRKFAHLVGLDHHSTWLNHFSHLNHDDVKVSCELSIKRAGKPLFDARIDSVRVPSRAEPEQPASIRIALTDITKMKQAESERAAYSRRLTDMARRLATLQDQERKRLSGDLHDRSSPNLAALALNISMIAEALPSPMPPELADLLEDTQGLIEDTVASIRDICNDLRPPVLDYAGLFAALESHAHAFHRRTGIEVLFEGAPFERRLPAEHEALLLRVAKEAFTNCAKHAHATTLRVSIEDRDPKIVLTIADDGVGFDTAGDSMALLQPGLGLITMRELVEFAGGSFHIDSSPGQGTRVKVEL